VTILPEEQKFKMLPAGKDGPKYPKKKKKEKTNFLDR
jgi:hypothetical protein